VPSALDGLTPSQLEAVTHPGGPLVVVAGAGTGKTRTLVARFVWLVEQGIAPEGILALTFSSAAADELRGRVETAVAGPYLTLDRLSRHLRQISKWRSNV